MNMVLSLQQSHCNSLPSSSDECTEWAKTSQLLYCGPIMDQFKETLLLESLVNFQKDVFY